MGQTIHHHAIPNSKYCPVKALARRVHAILSNNGDENKYICDVFHNNSWSFISPQQMITSVRAAVHKLNLKEHGIDPDLVGVHSLRAGGAMALRLHGLDDTVIMKLGRWTSLTFLQYIHNQIAHLSANISAQMHQPLQFTNIAAIETTPE